MNRRLLASALCLFLLGAKESSARKVVPPPTIDQLAGTWVGWQSDSMTFIRMDLHPDGTGKLVSRFLDRPPVLSDIPKWSLNRYRLVVSTTVVEQPSDPMVLSADVYGARQLSLRIVGRGGDWRTTAVLYPEGKWTEASNATRIRMEGSRE